MSLNEQPPGEFVVALHQLQFLLPQFVFRWVLSSLSSTFSKLVPSSWALFFFCQELRAPELLVFGLKLWKKQFFLQLLRARDISLFCLAIVLRCCHYFSSESVRYLSVQVVLIQRKWGYKVTVHAVSLLKKKEKKRNEYSLVIMVSFCQYSLTQ